MTDMRLYSIEDRFVEGEDQFTANFTDGILVPKSTWQRWSQECTTLMIATVEQGDTSQICTVTGYHEDDADIIFCPNWFFYRLVKGEQGTVNKLWDLDVPLQNATKVVVRPLDNEFYHVVPEEELSAYLSHFHTLQKGSTLVIPLKSLGGYRVDVFVESVEPDACVLLRGEVPLELAEPLETIAEWSRASDTARPPTPVPEPLTDLFSSFQSMIPESALCTQQQQPQIPSTNTAFSGRGYRLGSS